MSQSRFGWLLWILYEDLFRVWKEIFIFLRSTPPPHSLFLPFSLVVASSVQFAYAANLWVIPHRSLLSLPVLKNLWDKKSPLHSSLYLGSSFCCLTWDLTMLVSVRRQKGMINSHRLVRSSHSSIRHAARPCSAVPTSQWMRPCIPIAAAAFPSSKYWY